MASAATATPATTAQPAAGAKPPTPPPVLTPFTRGAREHTEGTFVDSTVQLDSSSHDLGPFDVPTYGYFASVAILVEATGGADSGETVAFAGDAPWNVFRSIALTDVNGANLNGPFGGFDLYLANKYGAYLGQNDPTLSPAFSAIAGASASGNFSFLLRIPVQISQRDTLGALANQNAASPYKLQLTINAASSIYSTPPDTLPAVRVRAFLEAWSQPPTVDAMGNPQAVTPPALGTTQFWTKQNQVVVPGQQTVRISRVGNLLRMILFVVRDDNGARIPGNAGNGFPDPAQILWDTRTLLNDAERLRQQYVADRYGYGLGQSAQDDGVYVYDFVHDLNGAAHGETRNLYLPTTQATRLELNGVFGSDAASVDMLVNDVAPAAPIAVS